MPSPVPTPVAAALGLVPTVLGGVRRLPGRAVQLPVHAVSHALTSLSTARAGYDNLAERGEQLIARLRGTSFDELEDSFEDSLQGTRLAAPYDRLEDALEDATESVTRLARKTGAQAGSKTGSKTGQATAKAAAAADKAAGATARAADKAAGGTAKAVQKADAKTDAKTGAEAGTPTEPADVPDAQAPKGEPTPAATQPDATRVDTAASTEVVDRVEQVSTAVGGEVLAHDELPLPDYDHLTLGSLRGRMRSLDLPQLIAIRDYEKAHADRLPVVTMLDNRIAKLANDPTAPLSGGSPLAQDAAKPSPSRGGSKVSPATGGPALNAPNAGVPTNPAQPRTTGSPGTNPNSQA